MDMLGDLAMEDDEEFPELSEDKNDMREYVHTDHGTAWALARARPRSGTRYPHRPVWH